VSHTDLFLCISSMMPLYGIYMAIRSKSKHKSSVVQQASLYGLAYWRKSSHQTNQHLTAPCPGDDVCNGGPKGKSLGWVWWTPLTMGRIEDHSYRHEGMWLSLGHAMAENKEIHWSKVQLTALWSPNGLLWERTADADYTSPLLACGQGHKTHNPWYNVWLSLG